MRFSMRLRSASSMSQGKLVAASTITCIGHAPAEFCRCKVERSHDCKAVRAGWISQKVGSCHQQGWQCCRGTMAHLLHSSQSARWSSMRFTPEAAQTQDQEPPAEQ